MLPENNSIKFKKLLQLGYYIEVKFNNFKYNPY